MKCPHGLGVPAACVDCMADGNLPIEPRPTVRVGVPVMARHASHCRGCNLPVNVGQMIRSVREHRGGWVHDGCEP